jgi:hypothetical protein
MKIFSDPLCDKEKPAVGFGALAEEGRCAIRIEKHHAEQWAPEKWFLTPFPSTIIC